MHNFVVMSELETHQRTGNVEMLCGLSDRYYRMYRKFVQYLSFETDFFARRSGNG